jgi:hypothetical protein
MGGAGSLIDTSSPGYLRSSRAICAAGEEGEVVKTRDGGVDRADFEACSSEHRRLRHWRWRRGVAGCVGVFESALTGSTTGRTI